jgi:DNA-binding NtrC family response regulator
VHNTLEAVRLRREVAALAAEAAGADRMLGASRALEEVRELIARAAPTDARVLILGESGTGKELVADALHRGSPRRDRPFIKVNCAAIPEHLIESELFGYARGAFTDARSAKPGLFEEADAGTLFLDEIGDMAVGLQARLLRVLEDGVVRRLGEARDRQVDVRVLAATHEDLARAVAEGRFREDLYFRLSNLPIRVPPLRERTEDIPGLFAHFVEYFRVRHRCGPRRIDAAVYPLLGRHPWPGNVRELKALAERLVVFGGDPITPDLLPAAIRCDLESPPAKAAVAAGAAGGRPAAAEAAETPPAATGGPGSPTGAVSGARGSAGSGHPEPGLPAARGTEAASAGGTPRRDALEREPVLPLRDFRARVERRYIEQVLAGTGWNFAAAARLLGLERTYLHQKAVALGIRRPADPGDGE